MKLYTLIRKDLPTSYQAVQAGHAVAEYLLKHKTEWDNGTIIYLGIKDEKELEKWEYLLGLKDIKYETFIEPDIGNQKTALTCITSDFGIFKRLSLL